MHDELFSRTGIPALDRLGASLDEALQRLDAQEAAQVRRRVRVPARVGRPRLAFAIAAAVIASAIALLWTAFDSDTAGPFSVKSALAEISKVASLQTLPADDQYVYTQSTSFGASTSSTGDDDARDGAATRTPVALSTETRSWLSVERRGLVEVTTLRVRSGAPIGGSDGTAPETVTTKSVPPLRRYEIGERSYDRSELLAYPTEPQDIYDRLASELPGASGAAQQIAIWQSLTRALEGRSAPLPQDLRAGLVSTIGLLPNVRTLGVTEDPLGREGLGFALTASGFQETIIFDQKTAAVLYADRRIAVQGAGGTSDWRDGLLLESYALLDQKIVDELPDRTER